jgi:hypothetical protein
MWNTAHCIQIWSLHLFGRIQVETDAVEQVFLFYGQCKGIVQFQRDILLNPEQGLFQCNQYGYQDCYLKL